MCPLDLLEKQTIGLTRELIGWTDEKGRSEEAVGVVTRDEYVNMVRYGLVTTVVSVSCWLACALGALVDTR